MNTAGIYNAAKAALPDLLRCSLIGAAWFLFVVSGYFLSYQIFFTEVPLEQIADKVSGDVKRKDFRYHQVVYFRGHELQVGQKLQLDVGTPWIARVGKPSVEVFVEIEKPKDDKDAGGRGRIRISGLTIEPFVYELKPETQQRFVVTWTNKLGELNPDIEIEYLAGDGSPSGKAAPAIVLATNIVGFSVWPYIFLFAIAAMAVLMFAPAAEQRGLFWDWERNRWRLGLVGIAVLMYLLHSGGLTSNVMFDGHSKIGAACKNLWSVARTGHWPETTYRQSGIAIVSAMTAAIEILPLLPALLKGELNRVSLSVCSDYPTSGYLLYAFWLTGLLFLVTTLRAIGGVGLALVFAATTALYFPFMRDLFKPDSDAYFIVLFAFYLGFVLRLLYDLGSFRTNAAAILLLTLLMGFTKITPIFLTLLLPLTLLLKDWNAGHRRALMRCAVSFAALFIVFQTGKVVSAQFAHPERHIGIKGEPFQRHVLWHMLWAAYGNYDYDSAHDFVKFGRLRNERVSSRTGLPVTTYLRQSETATQQVYKPDVLGVVSERPGFFLSTALHRFHEDGLRFYRYNRLGARLENFLIRTNIKNIRKTPDTEQFIPTSSKISGAKRSGVSPAVSLIRYGEAWKVAPLIFIGKLTQSDMSRLADIMLLAAAVIGIFGFKSVPLRFFLVMVALAKIGFSLAFHDVDRYFMFCSWALLLGLSLFLYNLVGAVNREKI